MSACPKSEELAQSLSSTRPPADKAGDTSHRASAFTYIQACRGIAAMLVVAFHTGASFAADKYFGEPLFARLFRFGSSGVEFFFVLSGFIIYFVHRGDLGAPARLPSFLARRAIRLYPSYWLIFAVVAASAFVVPAFRDGLPKDAWTLAKSLLLAPQDPAIVGGTGAPLIIVAWSLHYEIIFYLAFAAFILSRALGSLIMIAAIAWWVAAALNWPGLAFPLHFLKPHYFVIFGLGVASGWIALRDKIAKPTLWIAAGAAVYFGCAAFEVGQMFLQQLPRSPGRLESVSLAYGLGSAALTAGLVAAEKRAPMRTPAWLTRMGDASYVLYLMHFPIISACAKVFTRVGGGLAWASMAFVLTFLICCAAAYAFHRLVEQPLLLALAGKRGSAIGPTFKRIKKPA